MLFFLGSVLFLVVGLPLLFFMLGEGEAYVTWGPWISAIALMLWLLMDVEKSVAAVGAESIPCCKNLAKRHLLTSFPPKDRYTDFLRCFPTSDSPVKVIRMQQQIQRQGIIHALCAYTLWGLAPIYFKTISAVPAAEILTHRMIWSCALLMVLTLIGRQWHKVQAVLRQPKVLLTLAFTSVTVGGNWLLFIWAINNGHMLDASLGYYINPLFNVLLGMVFLSQKLRRLQWWAVGLAVIGVAVQLIAFGSLPWIALVLASSFAIYGLIRKKLALDALTGLLIETMIMSAAGRHLPLGIRRQPHQPPHAKRLAPEPAARSPPGRDHGAPALLHRRRHPAQALHPGLLPVHRPQPDVHPGGHPLRGGAGAGQDDHLRLHLERSGAVQPGRVAQRQAASGGRLSSRMPGHCNNLQARGRLSGYQ